MLPGRDDLKRHEGLEDDGPRLRGGGAHRVGGRDLVRERLRRTLAPRGVEQRHLDVLERVAFEDAALGCLASAVLDHPARLLAQVRERGRGRREREPEPEPARERSHADPRVPEQRRLVDGPLERGLRLGRRRDRLAQEHLRRPRPDRDAELAPEALGHDLEVELAHP